MAKYELNLKNEYSEVALLTDIVLGVGKGKSTCMVIHDYAINPDCYCKSTITLFDPFVPTGKGILATSLIPHHQFFDRLQYAKTWPS